MCSEEQKAYVVSLVRAHLITEPEYRSWVPPYTKVRWAPTASRCVAERVGGHWRRRPHCKSAIDALDCVCKQVDLADPGPGEPPLGHQRA